jgi:hypothetical protein
LALQADAAPRSGLPGLRAALRGKGNLRVAYELSSPRSTPQNARPDVRPLPVAVAGTTRYSVLHHHGDQMAAAYDASENDVQYIQNKFMPISVYEGYEDYKPETTSSLYREVASKLIVGELPMSAWDGYVKEWYEKGGQIVTERATKWYKDVHNIR